MNEKPQTHSEAFSPPTGQPGSLVLALDDTSASFARVGGKGASLARLAAAGLPVPPGFHVTTDAYQLFVRSNRLQQQILATVSTASLDQPATCEAAAQTIDALFAQHGVPNAVVEAVRQAYRRLGEGDLPVAVRSSATAEDLPELSFAGQQETFLNMCGEDEVIDAVKRCWASLWTARAISYRLRNHITPADVSQAVVVQELVPADAAGILFTAHPVTSDYEQLVINAAWGLGEAIVGGMVTPDTLVVDKRSGTIVSAEINEKDVMTVRTTTGTHEEPVPVERRREAVLSAAQTSELAQRGVQIEALYGQPMDIEWALADRRFFILQARPITTLRCKHRGADAWNDSLTVDCLWTRGNIGEAAPDVVTPCSRSLLKIVFDDMMPTLFRRRCSTARKWRTRQCGTVSSADTRAGRRKMGRSIARARIAAHEREAARSEQTRVFWPLRAFVLRAGELSRCGDKIFFLSIGEIIALLNGDRTVLAAVPERQAIYAGYAVLPPYPAPIRGHFDPFQWAANPERRSDMFDESRTSVPQSDAVTGFPGSPGIVEGRARVVLTVEEGEQQQSGEVLVTTLMNVGWTPLFPRAVAVVTDVGAPLSHAAIVARELGMPAVVGCGNATMRLHTGDWLRVNGELGSVEVLRSPSLPPS